MADAYLGELLTLPDVERQSPALWSRFARQIVSEFTQRGWRRSDVPETRLLLSYLLIGGARSRVDTLWRWKSFVACGTTGSNFRPITCWIANNAILPAT